MNDFRTMSDIAWYQQVRTSRSVVTQEQVTGDRQILARTGKRLELFTVGWNTLEGIIAMYREVVLKEKSVQSEGGFIFPGRFG